MSPADNTAAARGSGWARSRLAAQGRARRHHASEGCADNGEGESEHFIDVGNRDKGRTFGQASSVVYMWIFDVSVHTDFDASRARSSLITLVSKYLPPAGVLRRRVSLETGARGKESWAPALSGSSDALGLDQRVLSPANSLRWRE